MKDETAACEMIEHLAFSTGPGISQDAARLAVQAYVEPYPVGGAWGKTELLLVPVVKGQNVNSVKVGEGFDYVLAWAVRPRSCC